MIRHQDPGMDSPTGALAHLSERRQKDFPVPVIAKNCFPPISPIEEMIDGACKFHAGFPGHERGDPTRPVASSSSQFAEIHRLTPSALERSCSVARAAFRSTKLPLGRTSANSAKRAPVWRRSSPSFARRRRISSQPAQTERSLTRPKAPRFRRIAPTRKCSPSKRPLGESVGASSLWQTIGAVQSLCTEQPPTITQQTPVYRNRLKTAIVSSCGLNQQTAGLRLVII